MTPKKRKKFLPILKSDGCKEIITGITDMTFDEFLELIVKEPKLLQEIPGVKWLFAFVDIKNSIQNASFLKKYFAFIGQIQLDNFSDSDLLRLEDMLNDKETIDKIIENNMIFLDRYHNDLKAKLLGKLFIETFKYQNFSIDEYNSLLFSIEQIHPFEGIEKLKSFYLYKLDLDQAATDEKEREIREEIAKLDYQPLMMTGLLSLPRGAATAGNLGGASINDKGMKFYKYIVQDLAM